MVDAYPLQFPSNRSRTKYIERSNFDTTFGATRDILLNEIR